MNHRASAAEVIANLLDPGSFESWDQPIDTSPYPPDYRRVVEVTAAKAGTDESVVTGRGRVRGRPVAVVVSEFGFLAGSIGRGSAQRIVTAVRRATAEGLPLLASTASGGTRMQEGTPAFVEMIGISKAVMAHRATGLPYLVHLRNPTTGGVYASWGSLGQLTVAQPGALIGFLGPKVYKALNGQPFPAGVQVAENLADKGVIDAVVADEELREFLDRALAVLVDPPAPPTLPRRADGLRPGRSAWSAILETRRDGRVGVGDLLRYGCTTTSRLRGTGEGERDDSVVTAITRLDGQPCVIVGHDRDGQPATTPHGPAALRAARRAMRLAEELRLPLVTVIDTPGAELSPRAEENAIAGEIARCIATLSTLTIPTVSVLLGQGCGGGALALLAAQTVIATENAWLAPLSPEGASAILHGNTLHAVAMAEAQHLRAEDLHTAGVVHHLVPELPGDDTEALAVAVAAEVGLTLAEQTAGAPPGRSMSSTSKASPSERGSFSLTSPSR